MLNKSYNILSLLILALIVNSNAHEINVNSLFFTENKGQWNSNVLFKSNVDGGNVWFEKNSFTYHLYDKDAVTKRHISQKDNSTDSIMTHAFRLEFEGANSSQNIKVTPLKEHSNYENYFVGNNKSNWSSNVKSFEKINYSNLYEGINMLVESNENSFKYTFFVNPKIAQQLPKLKYDGAKHISLKDGNLLIETTLNTILEERPISYQKINGKRIDVPCNYILKDGHIEFEFPFGYNKNYELIIDPVVVFSSFSGSTSDNFGMSATHDNYGNLVAGGITFAIGYPVTLGAYKVTYSGAIDVVITKYSSNGTQLLFSTYLGGTGTEVVSSIIVDKQDNVFLYGATGSSNFPMLSNSYDNTFNSGIPFFVAGNGTNFTNGSDIYVSKLNGLGTQLLGSTFIGGTDNDGVNFSDSLKYNYGDFFRGEIQLNNQGNIVVASSTKSSNFPVSSNVVQTTNAGRQDVVVFSFDSNLSNLLWSTYLGGSNDESGYAVVIDNNNDVIVTGGTWSNNFQTTINALNQTYLGGRSDGFLTKLNSNGSILLASTFIGTASYDQCFFAQTDLQNNIYIIGQSNGIMPILNVGYSNIGSGQFIQKYDSNISQLIYSTVFGNGNGINFSPSAFLVDYCNNVYVSGWGGSILTGIPMLNMPVTANAQQSNTDGFNFYLAVFSANITSLLYATYYGGSQSQEHVDGGTSRFDKNGVVYQSVCAGCGSNSDFPITTNAWSATNNSNNCNNAVFKIDFQISPGSANFTSVQEGCAPLTITPENVYTGNSKYYWYLDGLLVDSVNANYEFNFTLPGTYQIKFKVQNPLCNFFDSLTKTIIVHPSPIADFGYSLISCSATVAFKDSSISNATPLQYNWDFGDASNSTSQNPNHNYINTGNFSVQLIITDNNTCKDTLSLPISIDTVFNFTINEKIISCERGKPVNIIASGGSFYEWSPSSVLNNSIINNPTAIVDSTTTFSVNIGLINSNGDTCLKTLSTKIIVSKLDSNFSVISANPDTIFNGEQSQLNFDSNIITSFEWSPKETVNNATIKNPIAKPTNDTWYEVKSIDSLGCSISKKVFVKVLSNTCIEPNIFVPNGFSPNGDNNNDILFVNGNFIESLVFKIYNRWGELIFESNNKNIGWDGTYKNKNADIGVYGYMVEAICYDGKTFFKKGNITLVR